MSDDGQSLSQSAMVYLGKVLPLNPTRDSDEIISLRREQLSLPPVETMTAGNLDFAEQQRNREIGRQKISEIQTRFYQLSDDQLRTALEELSTPKYPDLVFLVRRLRQASLHREHLANLYDNPELERSLIHTLGMSIVQQPAEAGFIKEQYIQSLNSMGKLKRAKQTVEVVRSNAPGLFELERDWLTTIQIQGGPSNNSFNQMTSRGLGLAVIALIAFFVIAALARLIAGGSN